MNETFSEKIKDAKKGDIIILKNIYFKNRSAKIVSESKNSLYELLCAMQDNPNLKIEIQGHICCQLVSDIEDISTLRAKAIFVYLVQNKIKRTRILYKGFGITKPIHPIPEKNPQEEEENRRVEILILEN
jgi:outer membrane protein OmpA-like peptidoglycan-associated protein